MSSIPRDGRTLQLARRIRRATLRDAIAEGTDEQVVKAANSLLEIDEQLSPSKDEPMTWKGPQTLPAICTYERRALHMGADPTTIYQGGDLALYEEIKERETEG